MQDELYQARILDHYKHPRNKRCIVDADITQKGSNPSCGDMLVLYMQVNKTTIVDASFEGEGCAISLAATSLLTEHVKGMKKEARTMTEQDMYDLLGVEVSAGRKKCALLALRTCTEGLSTHASKNTPRHTKMTK